MISERAQEAIEGSDTDELLRVIDGLCAARAWDGLVELRERCREAVARGKQVWGVEEHIRYRLALEGPASYAGPVVAEGRARFALGPLAEVAASTKTWAEMSAHLPPGPERGTFAAERVVRGDTVDAELPDLPGRLLDWEPSYPVARYRKDRVETPSPPLPITEPAPAAGDAGRVDDLDSETALADLVLPWTDQSNGRCQTVTVSGTAADAVAALGAPTPGLTRITAPQAMAWMAWAGASGGAHGARRGAAAGRYLAWWTVSVLADLDWPPDPGVVGDAVARLRWHWFDDGGPATGWMLRLAVEDPVSGLAWAVSAADAA